MSSDFKRFLIALALSPILIYGLWMAIIFIVACGDK